MATLTAQILVGTPHPNHDGINPTHYLFLSENDRPAWILVDENILRGSGKGRNRITWVPTVNNMLEDAFLMIAIHINMNSEVTNLARGFCARIESNRLELYSDLTASQRNQLYKMCRRIREFPKMIISVFRGSTIEKQLPVLDKYKMDVEVCSPRYSRLHSCWTNETTTMGSLV